MKKNLVLTLTGHDRIGIVEHVTRMVLEHHGNIEASRSTRLGGEFAMMLLIHAGESNLKALQAGIQRLKDEGFQITTCFTDAGSRDQYEGCLPYEIYVNGADHEGIIHQVTMHLAKNGINIENMETNMVKAPMSGTPLFLMNAVVIVPKKTTLTKLQDEMLDVAEELNVDIEISPYTG